MIKSLLLFLLLCSLEVYCSTKDIIKNKIEDVLAKIPPDTKAAILIYNPLTQDTIFKENHTASMVPASNTKLFTTATALSLMGGNYALCTKIMTADKNIRDGVINGDLYIKGFGNSLFTENDLEEMVRQLKKVGIKKITGNIVGDDYYFDELYTRADWIDDEAPNINLPPISALVIDRNRELVRRRIKIRRRRKVYYRIVTSYQNIGNPPLYIAELLREKLIESGIKVVHSAIKGHTPEDAMVLTESKILLKDLIKTINKHSDNFLAECLFKTLGAYASGKEGNSFYSTQAILKFLKDNGIYSEGTSVVDGSGISKFDLVTVGAIVGLLDKMYFDLNNFHDFYNSLSIAGVDGTLRHRMRSSSAENDFHGKTGTLHNVSSLSGYLKTQKGDDLIVSIIFDFKSKYPNYYRGIENEIVEILSDW